VRVQFVNVCVRACVLRARATAIATHLQRHRLDHQQILAARHALPIGDD